MDRFLSELIGSDEPDTGAGTRSATADKPVDPEREASREARQRRKADAEVRRNRKEFIERFTTGDPSVGFTTEEAVAHLREMREEMTPQEFRRPMQRTLEHLSPNQRDDFIRIMREYQAGAAQPAPAAQQRQVFRQARGWHVRSRRPPRRREPAPAPTPSAGC